MVVHIAYPSEGICGSISWKKSKIRYRYLSVRYISFFLSRDLPSYFFSYLLRSYCFLFSSVKGYYNDLLQGSIYNAGTMAGLSISRIINQHTAALSVETPFQSDILERYHILSSYLLLLSYELPSRLF